MKKLSCWKLRGRQSGISLSSLNPFDEHNYNSVDAACHSMSRGHLTLLNVKRGDDRTEGLSLWQNITPSSPYEWLCLLTAKELSVCLFFSLNRYFLLLTFPKVCWRLLSSSLPSVLCSLLLFLFVPGIIPTVTGDTGMAGDTGTASRVYRNGRQPGDTGSFRSPSIFLSSLPRWV